MSRVARSVVDTILGEGVAGDYNDYLGIASVISNRSRLTGRPAKSIISARKQFDAYGKPLPPGVERYRELAEKALKQVETEGPVHAGTYFATPGKAKNLPAGLHEITRTKGHIYSFDPKGRPIRTAGGVVAVSLDALADLADTVATGAIDVVDTATEALGLGQRGHASRRGPGLAALAPHGLKSLSWDGRMMDGVKGLAIHHTGGVGTPDDVVDTLNERGFGAHYVMDRQGNIRQTLPDMARVAHIKDAQNKSGLTNANTIGIEVIAKDDSDVTPAQRRAGLDFIKEMQDKYPGIGNNVFGHGELNKHKMADEGMSIVSAFREEKGLPEWDESIGAFAPTPTARPDPFDTLLNPTEVADLVPPGMEVARESLPPISSRAETVQPQSTAARVASSLADMLSPVSQAYAEPAPSETSPSLAALDRVVGTEVTQPESLPPDRPMPNKPATAPITRQDVVDFYNAETKQVSPLTPDQQIAALASERISPTPASTRHKGTIYQKVQPLSPEEALMAEVERLSPITTTERLSPLTPDSVLGTVIDPNETLRQAVVQARVAAPALPPPIEVPERKVFAPPATPTARPAVDFPAAPPTFSASDIYGGQVGMALDNTGQNIISRDELGRTAVTNKWGKTTVSIPGIGQVGSKQKGPLTTGGLSKKNPLGNLGKNLPSAKEIAGALIGGLIGEALAGPPGAVAGATLGRKALGIEDGPLSDLFGGFPSAPPSPPGGVRGSNRSAEGMRGISPAAADAVGRGQAGLY